MTFGFRAAGDTGNLQIDDEYPVFRVHAMGVTGDGGVFTFPTPAKTSEWPMVFIRPRGSTSWYMLMVVFHGSPGGWTGVTVQTTTDPWGWVPTANTGAWDIAIVVWDSLPSTERYGMRVFNANGGIVYDSGHRVMHLLHQANHWRYGEYVNSKNVVLYYYDLPAGMGLQQSDTYVLANPYASGITRRKAIDRDDDYYYRRYKVRFSGGAFTMLFYGPDKSASGITQQLIFGRMSP